MTTAHRAVILPVVLFMLLLLGLMVASFSFRVNADLASTRAVEYRLQTRLAAEAGIEKVKLILQVARLDMDLWYDNPEELNRIILWSADGDETVWGTNEELDEGTKTYRFSIVADDPGDDLEFCRFGITDESSKLNLNLATSEQLLRLVSAAAGDDEEIIPQDIVDAIIDWRDGDSNPRSEEGDTEGEYYSSLDKPYKVRNGLFDTVEELLLVKGVTGAILFGEDFDRNGLLTPNEDDGDQSFPLDDQDGELNRGLYAYLTVLSYESNVSNDNRPRIYLLGDEAVLREQLAEVFEEEPGIVDYIVAATRPSGGGEGEGEGGGGGPGGGRNNAGNRGTGPGGDDGGIRGGPRGDRGGGRRGAGETPPNRPDTAGQRGGDKDGARQQVRDEGLNEDKPPGGGEDEGFDLTDLGEAGESGEDAGGESGLGETGERDDAGSGAQPIRSPAELLRPQVVDGRESPSPLGPEHLAVLMDRTTTVDPQEQKIRGLININTAAPRVLRCIEGLSEEQVEAIVSTRASVEAEARMTTAWLVTEDIVDLETFIQIAGYITARGQQFTIEALGFADHLGMVTRLQVVVDMVGPIAQTIYHRDLSNVGGHFPIREEDQENIRVR